MNVNGTEVGNGRPDPTEPGVPACHLNDGFHWIALNFMSDLAWPQRGALTIGEWSAELWCWVTSYWGQLVGPECLVGQRPAARRPCPTAAGDPGEDDPHQPAGHQRGGAGGRGAQGA
jgi:hypothetical protein